MRVAVASNFTSRRGHAFTIVELTLTLSILGVLVAIGMPRYAKATARYRCDVAARRIVHDLNWARSAARNTGTQQVVLFDAALIEYRLTGQNDIDRRPGQTYTVRLKSEPYRVTAMAVALSGGVSQVAFDRYGFPDRGGTITVSVGGEQRTVQLNAGNGRATVQ